MAVGKRHKHQHPQSHELGSKYWVFRAQALPWWSWGVGEAPLIDADQPQAAQPVEAVERPIASREAEASLQYGRAHVDTRLPLLLPEAPYLQSLPWGTQ